MGVESFLADKLIGLGCFIGGVFFFMTGVASSTIDFILPAVFFILAVICLFASIWFVRKE